MKFVRMGKSKAETVLVTPAARAALREAGHPKPPESFQLDTLLIKGLPWGVLAAIMGLTEPKSCACTGMEGVRLNQPVRMEFSRGEKTGLLIMQPARPHR